MQDGTAGLVDKGGHGGFSGKELVFYLTAFGLIVQIEIHLVSSVELWGLIAQPLVLWLTVPDRPVPNLHKS